MVTRSASIRTRLTNPVAVSVFVPTSNRPTTCKSADVGVSVCPGGRRTNTISSGHWASEAQKGHKASGTRVSYKEVESRLQGRRHKARHHDPLAMQSNKLVTED